MGKQLDQYYRRRDQFIKRLGGKCVDCGSLNNLEFDHDDRKHKTFNISKCYSMNLNDLLIEVDKCKLRCKPCHLNKTKEVDGIKSEHGKSSMYKKGCRCSDCLEANRVMVYNWRAKKKAGL